MKITRFQLRMLVILAKHRLPLLPSEISHKIFIESKYNAISKRRKSITRLTQEVFAQLKKKGLTRSSFHYYAITHAGYEQLRKLKENPIIEKEIYSLNMKTRRAAVTMLYWAGASIKEIAKSFGISRSRVEQIIARTARFLRLATNMTSINADECPFSMSHTDFELKYGVSDIAQKDLKWKIQ